MKQFAAPREGQCQSGNNTAGKFLLVVELMLFEKFPIDIDDDALLLIMVSAPVISLIVGRPTAAATLFPPVTTHWRP